MMKKLFNAAGKRWIKHDNPKTVCPPGIPRVVATGSNIVVATQMRTGTHVLIDMIINNYDRFRNCPLYIDLDALVRRGCLGHDLSELIMDLSSYVVKTHYPQVGDKKIYEPALELLRENSVFVTSVRHEAGQAESLSKSFGRSPHEVNEILGQGEVATKYWAERADLIVNFADLISIKSYIQIASDIGRMAGCQVPPQEIRCYSDRSRLGVYYDKFSTRVLGYRSPRINTSIAYKI